MVRQIKKAMTWKPSCKTGSATFSQDFVVQHPQIIKKLFARVMKDNGKAWKMKKLSAEDFEVRGYISGRRGELADMLYIGGCRQHRCQREVRLA